MQHLIASDVVVPQLWRNALKVLVIIDLHCALVFIVLYELYHIVRAIALITGYRRIQEWTLQQMDINKFFTIFCQLTEELIIICKRYTGKIHPEILGKTLAVLIAVQDGIDIIEELLRQELRPDITESV